MGSPYPTCGKPLHRPIAQGTAPRTSIKDTNVNTKCNFGIWGFFVVVVENYEVQLISSQNVENLMEMSERISPVPRASHHYIFSFVPGLYVEGLHEGKKKDTRNVILMISL
uniref:Uncharacterized protein n=1 Tax=Xenopus tropicalis TaxID=8364 RepID=A0A1B8Y6R1_XENTR